MGSGMKRAVFTENVVKGLNSWLKNAKRNIPKNNNSSASSPRRLSFSWHSDTMTDISISEENSKHIRSSSIEITEEESTPCEVMISSNITTTTTTIDHHQKLDTSVTKSSSDQEKKSTSTSVVEEANPKIVTRGSYDGEISFGSSWKKLVEIRQDSGEITSIAEED